MSLFRRFGDRPAASRDWGDKTVLFLKRLSHVLRLSGRSAAWLARLVRDQEVEGSNPFAPTTPLKVQTGHIGDTLYRLHG